MPVSKIKNEDALWKRVSELGGASAFLLYLAEAASDRLTVSQATFFLLAATAEAQGKPKTRSQVIEVTGDRLTSSIRNSYKQLMAPSRNRPQALGWLEVEQNDLDEREKFLRLTPQGKAVISAALSALQPLEG